jgi:hypothetical protein
MRRFAISMLALCTLFAFGALAAEIDGKWLAEAKMPAAKKAASQEERTATFTLTLKSDGNQLSGTVAAGRGRATEIQEGKIDGKLFSFVTTQRSKKGDVKIVWSGTVEGSLMKGERGRAEARRKVQFTAKRQ